MARATRKTSTGDADYQMTGENRIVLNSETMKAAVQKWLDETAFSAEGKTGKVVVTDVKPAAGTYGASYAVTFTIESK